VGEDPRIRERWLIMISLQNIVSGQNAWGNDDKMGGTNWREPKRKSVCMKSRTTETKEIAKEEKSIQEVNHQEENQIIKKKNKQQFYSQI
jgi:hypothetical protein